MSSATKGSQRERAVKRGLADEGYVVVRTPASKSPVDLWAITPRARFGAGRIGCEVLAVQVKGNLGNPYKAFGPTERNELREIAARAGATPWLVHWPPRGKEAWIPEDRWPS